MQKILCPIDFSENSLTALEYAVKIGRAHKALLAILYVLPSQKSFYKNQHTTKEKHWANAEQKLRAMQQTIEENSLSKGLKQCSFIVIEGEDVTETIANMAMQDKHHLLVMGTKGAHDVTEAYVGSTTLQVISKVGIPVFCVPQKADYQKIDHVVFASDYHEEDKVVVQELLAFITPLKAALEIVHVSEIDNKLALDEQKEYQENMSSYMGQDTLDIKFIIKDDDIAQTLDHYMHQSKAEVLVLCKRERNFFEQLFSNSLTKRMSYFTDYPLLIYKTH